jgi:hypothetical protein
MLSEHPNNPSADIKRFGENDLLILKSQSPSDNGYACYQRRGSQAQHERLVQLINNPSYGCSKEQ